MRIAAYGPLTLLISSLLMVTSESASADKKFGQLLIEGLAMADNCLYALETGSSRQPADCRNLFNWQASQWPQLKADMDAKANDIEMTSRDQSNLRAYQQTLAQIQRRLNQ